MARHVERELRDLLKGLFKLDELRTFLGDLDDGAELLADFNWESVTLLKACSEVTDALFRRGLVDAAFFEQLRAARPRRAVDIERVSKLLQERGAPGQKPPSPQVHAPAGQDAAQSTSAVQVPASGPPPFMVRLEPKGELLVGREQALAELHAALGAARPSPIGRAVALVGAGGLGKTQLAVEYAHRFRTDYPGGVFWITADHELEPQLQAIADAAAWVAPYVDPSHKIAEARRLLPLVGDALVIVDNVEDFGRVKALFPAVTRPRLLLTSIQPLPVAPVAIELLLSPADARRLLCLESARDLAEPTEAAAADRILLQLGGWPMAIELTGAYLKFNADMSVEDYASLLDARGLDAAMWGDPTLEGASATRHTANLRATLRADTGLLKKHPVLDEILDVLAWSGSAAMGRSLLAAMLGRSELDLAVDLALGVRLQLLRREGEHRYRVHRLMAQVVREDSATAPEDLQRRARRVAEWFRGIRVDYRHLPLFEAELDHLEVWQKAATARGWAWEAAALLWLQAYPSFHWARYSDGVEILQRALVLYERVVPADDALEVNIRNDLSACLSARLDETDARVHLLRALALLDHLPPHCVAEQVQVLANRSKVEPDTDLRMSYAHRACAMAAALPVTDLHRVAAELALAHALAGQGRLSDAIERAEQQKNLLIVAFGRRHTVVAKACRTIGLIHTASGDFDLALSALDEASGIYNALQPDDQMGPSLAEHDRAEVHEAYARSLWKTDRAAALLHAGQAVTHEREALRLRRLALPRHAEGVTTAIYYAASSLWFLGGLSKDPAHRREAIELAEEGLRVGRQDTDAYAELRALHADFVRKGIPGFKLPRVRRSRT